MTAYPSQHLQSVTVLNNLLAYGISFYAVAHKYTFLAMTLRLCQRAHAFDYPNVVPNW
ncbi:MAG: hypothetical protein Q3971_01295 [Moraxella sp.]|nr:hypothetical protein [Moraxella sp.]